MIGTRLTNLRKSKGLTQKDLCDLLNLTRGTYAHYETNKRQPDYETLKKMATFYGVTTDYLLGHTDIPTTPAIANLDEYILQAQDLVQALIRIFELESELNIDDATVFELMKKARDKYALPQVKPAELAACGPRKPATGPMDNGE